MIPFVTVVIPTHLEENRPYLKACIESVLGSENIEYEVIVVAGYATVTVDYNRPPGSIYGNIRMFGKPELDNAGKKINWAFTQAAKHATHYMILTDDVILAKHTLYVLANNMPVDMIVNPMSNSDSTTQFMMPGFPYPVKMSLEDLAGYQDPRNFPKLPVILSQKVWVSYYCTMFTRSAWERIGPLDLQLDSRHNDQFHCMRAAILNIPSAINYGAYAHHFGSQTLPKVTTNEDLDKCSEHFKSMVKDLYNGTYIVGHS